MSITYDFKGHVALATGAASGMGLATARAFAHAGAAVTLANVTKPALQPARDEITSAGGEAIGVVCDVSDEAEVAAMVKRTVASFGRLDAAFNNASIQIPASEIFSEHAHSRASEPKELSIVHGAGHVDLDDRVNLIPWNTLQSFFGKHLPRTKTGSSVGGAIVDDLPCARDRRGVYVHILRKGKRDRHHAAEGGPGVHAAAQ